MALTLQNLADALPPGTLTVSGSTVMLDISLLLNQAVTDLSSETVSDVFRKLSKGAFDAQTAHNTANPTSIISSYGLPRSGVVTNEKVNETVTITWTRALVSDSAEVENQ